MACLQPAAWRLMCCSSKKSDVRNRYGVPAKEDAPVGDPPITRWDYNGWSVYFEYDLVLYTVLHKGQVLDDNKG
jgi:hypothetical protein